MQKQITFVERKFDTLDRIANTAEEILWRVGLPGQVRGGFIYPDAVWMEVHWQCNPAQVDKCNRLNAEIRRVFGCYGGVDVQTLHLVLTSYKTQMTDRVKR
ncbi:MAG: hypothetical protein U0350_36460 [Caldilineaceae bacterium]